MAILFGLALLAIGLIVVTIILGIIGSFLLVVWEALTK